MTPVALGHGERIAVIVTGALASISTLSVTLLLLHIFSVAIIPFLWRSTSHNEYAREERVFLRTNLGVFVVCLLCSDLVQGISGYFQFVWAAEGRVFEGSMCTAQAAMLLFGDNGTAVWAAVISFHTVLTVVGGKRIPGIVVTVVVISGWALTALLTFIGPLAIARADKGPFYGIAGAWCFVTSKYEVARIYVHYFPLLLCASLITINYALVALVLSGVLVYQNRTWKFVAPYRRQGDSSYRWHPPKFSFSRLQRSASSASNIAQSSGSGSKEVDGGVGRVPYRPGTAQSNYSTVTKGTPQDIEAPVVSSHKGGPTVTTPPAEQLQRRPTIPKSQAQFRNLALKMLWYPIVYIALVLPIACGRLDLKRPPSLHVMLGFMCLLWLMGLANVIVYVTTRRIGGSRVLRKPSLSRSRGKASQDETDPGRSIQIHVDRHTKVDHVISLSSRAGSPSEGGSPQYPSFDPSDMSPTFPAKSFYPPMGATDGDLEAQSRWWPEPTGNEEGAVRVGKAEKIGVAV